MLEEYYCPAPKPDDANGTQLSRKRWHRWLIEYTPLRFSPGWRSFVYNELFDRQLAQALTTPAQSFMGFVGKSLHSFQKADQLGYEDCELIAANSHVHNLKRLHDQAHANHGMNDSWLNDAQLRKTLREYETADYIFIHSQYTKRTFLNAGIPASKLRRTYLSVHPRFTPPDTRPDDDVYRIVYVGRLDATKGIPLLLEAFAALPLENKQLTLVGGWSTRPMRKYMEQWLTALPRIEQWSGDPLPALHEADVFVHPTYEDGFGYAPMEALACGVPVIVTRDTGMKEYVQEGANGYVIPTGDRAALMDRLEQLYHNPLATTSSLLPVTYTKERAALPSLIDDNFHP